MNVQEQIKVLKEQISSSQELLTKLEDQIKKEQEFPQIGDTYWRIDGLASVDNSLYNDSSTDNRRLSIGNFFKSEKQTEFSIEKLKVEAELREYSKPFEILSTNWLIAKEIDGTIEVHWSSHSENQGAIYFESSEKARQAIEAVGEERIMKYIFEVE